MKYLFIFIILCQLFTCLLYCTEESPKPSFNCSVEILFECDSIFKPVYNVQLNQKERILIQAEYWIQSELDSNQYCHAANGVLYTQTGYDVTIKDVRILDSLRYERFKNCKDEGKIKIIAAIYEQSLTDFQYKRCEFEFYYKK